MSARQLVALMRAQCRRHGVVLDELSGRGKGSHRVYVVRDPSGVELGRLTLPSHPGDLSWPVLRDVEGKLEHLFGQKWTEKR